MQQAARQQCGCELELIGAQGFAMNLSVPLDELLQPLSNILPAWENARVYRTIMRVSNHERHCITFVPIEIVPEVPTTRCMGDVRT